MVAPKNAEEVISVNDDVLGNVTVWVNKHRILVSAAQAGNKYWCAAIDQELAEITQRYPIRNYGAVVVPASDKVAGIGFYDTERHSNPIRVVSWVETRPLSFHPVQIDEEGVCRPEDVERIGQSIKSLPKDRALDALMVATGSLISSMTMEEPDGRRDVIIDRAVSRLLESLNEDWPDRWR